MKPLLPAAFAVAMLAAPPALAQARRASAAPAWNKGAPLTITMSNRGFAPARLTLRQGAGYILRLRNVSDRTHTFSARSFFRLARVDPRDQAWVARNEVEVPAGRTATLHLIAPDTPNAIYDFRSTRIGDMGENMKGTIHVR